jgi:hypothetical protein
MRRLLLPCLGCLILALSACGGKTPTFTEVEGDVLLNGQALPGAQVTFVPVEPTGLGPEMNSTAVTDENGHFKLKRGLESGTVVGKHRITVTEAPVPDDLRGQSIEAQARLAEYQKKLKNRPIPPRYGAIANSGLAAEVKPNGGPIKVELSGQ